MAFPLKNRKALVLLIGEVMEDPRVLKTSRSLRDAGADVTVACSNPSGRPVEEEREGLRIIRFPHRRDSLLKRGYLWLQGRAAPEIGRALTQAHEELSPSPLRASARNLLMTLNFRSFMRENLRINRLMIRALSGERFDLAHANDMDTLSAGCALKRSGAVRLLLYDSHEFWPGMGVPGSGANTAVRRLEAAGIARADYVMTVNPFISEMLRREYNLERAPAVLLNCPCRDDGEADPDAVHCPVRVLYQGKVQAFRGTGQLIRAFHQIKGADLTVSGDGPLLERYRRVAVSEGLSERVQFTGRFNLEDTLSIVRRHDIGVLPFSPATVSITYSSPNKLFDYLMGGLAVASTDLPFMRKMIEEHRIGVVFPHNDPEYIADAIQSLVDDIGSLREYRRNARRAALENYSWERQFEMNYPWKG